MARIRSIKPSFWSDEAVADLSRDARLLLLGLISMADDDGRFVASHATITGYVFPHDRVTPARLARWLTEIADTGTVVFYTVGKRDYGYFPKYRTHQRIIRGVESRIEALRGNVDPLVTVQSEEALPPGHPIRIQGTTEIEQYTGLCGFIPVRYWALERFNHAHGRNSLLAWGGRSSRTSRPACSLSKTTNPGRVQISSRPRRTSP